MGQRTGHLAHGVQARGARQFLPVAVGGRLAVPAGRLSLRARLLQFGLQSGQLLLQRILPLFALLVLAEVGQRPDAAFVWTAGIGGLAGYFAPEQRAVAAAHQALVAAAALAFDLLVAGAAPGDVVAIARVQRQQAAAEQLAGAITEQDFEAPVAAQQVATAGQGQRGCGELGQQGRIDLLVATRRAPGFQPIAAA